MPISIIRKFLKLEAASGIILFITAVIAIILVNSPLSKFYESILHLTLTLQLGSFALSEPLIFWINEGLMTFFFLLVGLELKREFLEGELTGLRKIVLPGVGAVGGMLAPALIFIFINYHSSATFQGWAIPMATDIAFALGVLSLFSRYVPIGLKLFLMALSIFDDLGAIIIIALFYSHGFSWVYFSMACLIIAILWLLNSFFKVSTLFPYLILGMLLWGCVLHSGVHASITGVILSLAIPLRQKLSVKRAPLHVLEEKLHPWVAFLVMPIFAFANAGLSFTGVSWSWLYEPLVLGIILALFLGKQLGVFSFAWLMVKLGWANLPNRTTWLEMYGVALICGVGFTMSLFLGTLAFQSKDPIYLTEVRLGVLIGSLLSGLMGAMILRVCFRKKRKGGLFKNE